MSLAGFENVMVLVEGIPEGTLVSLLVHDEGLEIAGYGMLSWAGSHVEIEDRAPHGMRVTVGRPEGNPSIFFIPVESLAAATSLGGTAKRIDGIASKAGAQVHVALTAA